MSSMDTDGFFQVKDGTKIFYKIKGQGSPLLLLHGNGGSSRYFIHQVPYLEKFFRLILIDSRAHGRSGNKGSELTFELMAKDIKEGMDFFNINRASILGFSDGANLALVFSKLYPERVEKLVLNSANLDFSSTTMLSRILSHLQYAVSLAFSPFSKHFKNKLSVAGLLFKNLNITDEDLKKILSKTLVIVGENDLIYPEHTRRIASLIPNATLIEVKGHGHLLARTNAKFFNTEVKDFLMER